MKIKITVEDRDGHVKIESDPSLPKLVEMYKRGGADILTPALTYAVLGLQKMFANSDQVQGELDREAKEERAMNSGIIIPFKPKLVDGPQIVE